jgi:hypothetical protein
LKQERLLKSVPDSNIYFLDLPIKKRISAIIPTTASTPTQTPALNIPAMASQLLNIADMQISKKLTCKNLNCFMLFDLGFNFYFFSYFHFCVSTFAFAADAVKREIVFDKHQLSLASVFIIIHDQKKTFH